jgi:hypothetical protein
MEAAGIFKALTVDTGNAKVACVKLVTDGPDQPASRLKLQAIREMIGQVRPQLAEWFNIERLIPD